MMITVREGHSLTFIRRSIINEHTDNLSWKRIHQVTRVTSRTTFPALLLL